MIGHCKENIMEFQNWLRGLFIAVLSAIVLSGGGRLRQIRYTWALVTEPTVPVMLIWVVKRSFRTESTTRCRLLRFITGTINWSAPIGMRVWPWKIHWITVTQLRRKCVISPSTKWTSTVIIVLSRLILLRVMNMGTIRSIVLQKSSLTEMLAPTSTRIRAEAAITGCDRESVYVYFFDYGYPNHVIVYEEYYYDDDYYYGDGCCDDWICFGCDCC